MYLRAVPRPYAAVALALSLVLPCSSAFAEQAPPPPHAEQAPPPPASSEQQAARVVVVHADDPGPPPVRWTTPDGDRRTGRFTFGSYGRVMTALDGRGRRGRDADLVAHGSRSRHA